MSDYKKVLGDTVKRARKNLKLSQIEAAEKANIDSRTILNIENYNGNPKFEVLYPLVRALNIDVREIFYPQNKIENPKLNQLLSLIETCNEQEADALLYIINAVLTVLRNNTPQITQKKKED